MWIPALWGFEANVWVLWPGLGTYCFQNFLLEVLTFGLGTTSLRAKLELGRPKLRSWLCHVVAWDLNLKQFSFSKPQSPDCLKVTSPWRSLGTASQRVTRKGQAW